MVRAVTKDTTIRIPGGAMEIAWVAGLLHGLRENFPEDQLTNVRRILGSSAGAEAAAFYLTGQVDRAQKLLTHDLPAHRFVSRRGFFARYLVSHPIAWRAITDNSVGKYALQNTRFSVFNTECLRHLNADLDVNALKNNPVPLAVNVYKLHHGVRTRTVQQEDPLALLDATTRLPYFTQGAVDLSIGPCKDAALFDTLNTGLYPQELESRVLYLDSEPRRRPLSSKPMCALINKWTRDVFSELDYAIYQRTLQFTQQQREEAEAKPNCLVVRPDYIKSTKGCTTVRDLQHDYHAGKERAGEVYQFLTARQLQQAA